MKTRFQRFLFGLSAVLLLGLPVKLDAFALLGPVQPWMQASNGVIFPDDIGGPMFIGNGYRWNVPVLTYGFDQSFLNYFGTNGVAAVEGAIQVLNALPPASQMALTNYPFDSLHNNYEAQTQSLLDLKSATLFLLLEHMGLAEPTRSVYVLQQWNPVLNNYSVSNDNGDLLSDVFEGTNLANYVVPMNYDPQTLNPSPYVDDVLYSGVVQNTPGQYSINVYAVDPYAEAFTAVADNPSEFGGSPGAFYSGLTYDDVGGLIYLLSTNNVNYETLLPGIAGSGTNVNSFVNGAWRPGVDKISFIPQPMDSHSGAFLPTTNFFTDSYLTNGILKQQQLARVISQPDFLFSAADIISSIPSVPFYGRTGTTNWVNNAAANGNTNGAGPGVIQPPVQLVFNKLGRQLEGTGNVTNEIINDVSVFWGSFDGSTNAAASYPILQTGTSQIDVRMWLTVGQTEQRFDWKTSSAPGTQYALQTSTDLTHWTTVFMVTNNGSVCTYLNNPVGASAFYRLTPQ